VVLCRVAPEAVPSGRGVSRCLVGVCDIKRSHFLKHLFDSSMCVANHKHARAGCGQHCDERAEQRALASAGEAADEGVVASVERQRQRALLVLVQRCDARVQRPGARRSKQSGQSVRRATFGRRGTAGQRQLRLRCRWS
jgi:hypothetical protein